MLHEMEEVAMNLAELNKVAQAMVAPGRGILAADESSGTIKKRFDAIGVESTADNRRDYRELLFRSSEAMSKYISGVILYDETIRQNAKDGTPLVKVIANSGAIPGIKVDKGTKPLPFCPCEVITEWLLKTVFEQLYYQKVALEGMVLKPNMVIAGKKAKNRASVEEVAEKTVRVLKACVPAAVPGIAFLSGGQSDEEATAHLDAMNRIGGVPWRLTFSYGRALQAAPQKAWSGRSENVAAAQRAFTHRAIMNSLATRAQWKQDLERKAA